MKNKQKLSMRKKNGKPLNYKALKPLEVPQ